MAVFSVNQTVFLNETFTVELPADATYDEILEAAYQTKSRIKYSEVEDRTIIRDDGKEIEE
jgi:hypothetical protein